MSKLSNDRIITLLVLLLAACGKGGESSQDQDPGIHVEPLRVPENVHLHGATETTLTFQWDAVSGAESYKWWLSQNGTQVQTGISQQRNVTVEGLQPATRYGFMVSAMAQGKTFAHSNEIDATTQGTTPEPPGPDVTVQCVDAPLVLTLDAAPVLGTSGLVRIIRADGTEVDRIDLADIATVNVREDGVMVPREQLVNPDLSTTFMDALSSGGRKRHVHYTPFRISGKSLIIKPHTGVLDFGKEYYVTVDESVCGKAVAAGEWRFTTKGQPSGKSLAVNPDGSADFCTLQGALTYADDDFTIHLAAGTYEGLLYLREKKNITVKGTSRDGTVIAYPNCEAYMNGSSARCLWLVENCDNLVLENLTIHNTYGEQGQAECIYFNSGSNAHRLTMENCALLSLQDTFLTKGEVWVHNSLIAGNVDFIWGYPKVCLFEDCEIRCEYHKNGGYIIQARCPSGSKGFVFLNCNITAASGVKDGSMYLARSAGQSDCFDNVTYVNCSMPSAIAPAGWYTSPAPNPSVPTATAGWKEYGTKGVSTASRNAYGKTLTAEEAAAYSSKNAILNW